MLRRLHRPWSRSAAWPFSPTRGVAFAPTPPTRGVAFAPSPSRGEAFAPAAVRDRPFLPGADDPLTNLPSFATSWTPQFPTLYTARGQSEDDDLEDWAEGARDLLREKLPEHGAMLFRNVPGLSDSQDLTLFARYLKFKLTEGDCSSYTRNMQARSMQSKAVSKFVRTASDEPPAYTIEPHHEFHTAAFPHKLMLFCQDPAPAGGEWIVGDGRTILADLDPKVVEKFEKLEVTYRVFYESKADDNRYTNWQTNVAPTKEGVAEYMERKGYSWSWGADDSLTYWKKLNPIQSHPITGERCFFQQIHAHHKTFYTNHPWFAGNPVTDDRWPVHVTYGDGSEIEPEVIRHLRETSWKHCVVVAPQKGDLLVVDNYLAMHGRMGYEGERKVFVVAVYN